MWQKISKFILRSLGWKIENNPPKNKKYLIIGAYHTSNWDFLIGLLCLSALGLKFNWVGKHTLFLWPFGLLFKSMGGIPVNRSVHTGFIHKITELYNNSDELIIAMSPEGTRSKTDYWKSGFYYIALSANIPLDLGYIDYPNKQIGIADYFTPTGDIQQDLKIIKEFYKNKSGKNPLKQGDIKIRDRNQ